MDKITLQDIQNILEEVIDISGVTITGALVLGEDLPVDSTEMLRIISRLESRFKLKFRMADILALSTLEDIVQAVNRIIDAR